MQTIRLISGRDFDRGNAHFAAPPNCRAQRSAPRRRREWRPVPVPRRERRSNKLNRQSRHPRPTRHSRSPSEVLRGREPCHLPQDLAAAAQRRIARHSPDCAGAGFF